MRSIKKPKPDELPAAEPRPVPAGGENSGARAPAFAALAIADAIPGEGAHAPAPSRRSHHGGKDSEP